MPRDYKSNTYRTRKPKQQLGLDGWDRLLIVIFITVLALVVKYFIVEERSKTDTQTVAGAPQNTDAKVNTATSTAAAVAKEMAEAGGLTEEELNADPQEQAVPPSPPELDKPTPAVPNLKVEADGNKHTATAPPHQDTAPVEPHFDFYTILPKVEVVIPDNEIKTRIREEKLGEADVNAKYIMQAGSFRDSPDAEKLKAKLTALGIESRIEQAQVGEVMWHRVKVGPYSGMSSVMTVKSLLRDNGVDAIVLEFK
jgi:cell division protein FtsN